MIVSDILNVIVVRQVVLTKSYETMYINGVYKQTTSGSHSTLDLDWETISTGCSEDVAIREVMISPYVIGK